MCNECEELAREENLGMSGVAALLSGKCMYKQEPKEEVIIIKEREVG